jgi:hypothetical protein
MEVKTQQQTVVATLDEKIAEVERALDEAKRAAALVTVLAARLEHISETRALFVEDDDIKRSRHKHHRPLGGGGEPSQLGLDHRKAALPKRQQSAPSQGSTGDRIIAILRTAEEPLFIRDVYARLAISKPGISYSSASGALSHLVKRGWVTRPKTGYYALP